MTSLCFPTKHCLPGSSPRVQGGGGGDRVTWTPHSHIMLIIHNGYNFISNSPPCQYVIWGFFYLLFCVGG